MLIKSVKMPKRVVSIFYIVSVYMIGIHTITEKPEKSLCTANFSCIPLHQCTPKPHSIFYPCHSGLNLYCCPNEDVLLQPEKISTISERSNFFPVECGVIHLDDKITGGQDAAYGQFPWMTLLGYKQRSVPITEFLCGGTLITDRYVLTAAHCAIISDSHTLVTARFGEHNLKTETDCYTLKKATICAAPHVDIDVETYTIHPEYNMHSLKNDIALVRTRRSVAFSDYIQPICLPFERSLQSRSLVGQNFIISGWGKTDAKKLGGSAVLQYASVSVWEPTRCHQVLPPEVKNISDAQICANGKEMDACKGDSGGPMFNTTRDIDRNLRTFQIGIVSFATTVTCGFSELPPIYTRVDRYLDWIVDSIVEKNYLKEIVDSGSIHFENN